MNNHQIKQKLMGPIVLKRTYSSMSLPSPQVSDGVQEVFPLEDHNDGGRKMLTQTPVCRNEVK